MAREINKIYFKKIIKTFATTVTNSEKYKKKKKKGPGDCYSELSGK
jgi:hypothetical protein